MVLWSHQQVSSLKSTLFNSYTNTFIYLYFILQIVDLFILCPLILYSGSLEMEDHSYYSSTLENRTSYYMYTIKVSWLTHDLKRLGL